MAVNIADAPFSLDDYLKKLKFPGYTPGNPTPVPDTPVDVPYDPYNTQNSGTSPTGGTSTVVDWSTRNTSKENGGGVDENGVPSGSGGYDPSTSGPNAPQTTKTPGPCPEGYEWEDGGPDYPNGRCKIKGLTWEESQGKIAPGWEKATPAPAPAASIAGGGSGVSKAPASNYAFDLKALLAMLGPSYESLVAKIRAGTDPYNPSVTEALVGNRKVAAERQKLDQERQLQAQRSAAGMGTQGATQQDLRSIAANADIAGASDINQIRENAIKANYAAQVQRIDQEMQALNSHANFVLGLASSDSARQSAQLQYAAQANALLAQRQNLELQLQAELDRLKLQLLFSGA